MKSYSSASKKALQASYEISHPVTKNKKPYTIVDNLITATIKIAEIMFGKPSIKMIPHSKDTMTRWTDDTAEDIILHVIEK